MRTALRLNPYSNGILSDSQDLALVVTVGVLILILMEYSLTAVNNHRYHKNLVLILILMEYSLTEYQYLCKENSERLNPYSNGILSDRKNILMFF